MTWSETIQFGEPPSEIHRVAEAPDQDWGEIAADRERAAYARGRRDGETSLSQQLVEQRAETAALQQGILQTLSQTIPTLARQSEEGLIRLALEAVGKIVAGIPVKAPLIEATIREAIREIEDASEVTVQLHPEDLALLKKSNSPLMSAETDGALLRFSSSHEITRGGCVVQTRFGLVDARREAKLDKLSKTILE